MTPPIQRRAMVRPDLRPERNVLVVDDVPEIGALYRHLLRRVRSARVRAVVEVRGAAAIRALESGTFDLVITDLRMPGAGGREVVEAAQRTNPRAPILLISGHLDHAGELPAGLAGILPKPLHVPSVLALVEGLLRPDERASGRLAVSAPGCTSNTPGETDPPHGRGAVEPNAGGVDDARPGR